MAKQEVMGIYKITNTITRESYIGYSTNIYARWHEHKHCLERRRHINGRLQNSFNTYGIGAFTHEILIECELEKLQSWEQWFIDTLCPEFNIVTHSNAPNEKKIAKMKHRQEKWEKFMENYYNKTAE